MPLTKEITIARGALALLGKRVREVGAPGLTVWVGAAEGAVESGHAKHEALAASVVSAMGELRVSTQATRLELFAAIERANAALRGAVETAGLACLALLLMAASVAAGGDDDDMARRAGRTRGGRRRDGMVALIDAETGEAL